MSEPIRGPLAARRILVVEDDMMIAMLEEQLIDDAGGEVVGPAGTVREASVLLESHAIDGAILDVNLGGETAYPVAEALARAGLRFVFVTGYGQAGLIEAYRRHPTIKKPFPPATFGQDVATALGLADGEATAPMGPPPDGR